MSDKIRCPKCGSDQIHSDRKGFSTGKAVAGALIGGVVVGGLAGTSGSNKIRITCLKCGNIFKPGEGLKQQPLVTKNYPEGVSYIKQERANYQCSHCGKTSSFDEMNKKCPSCGSYIKESDRVGYVKIQTASNKKSSNTAGIITIFITIVISLFIIVKCS